jgi:hypothetical protein
LYFSIRRSINFCTSPSSFWNCSLSILFNSKYRFVYLLKASPAWPTSPSNRFFTTYNIR